jgi:hypothetical protein
MRRCSLPMPAELQVHAACQWREVAAASVAPAGTTVLVGVAVEKRGEALQNTLASGIGQVFLGSLAGGPGVALGGRGRTRALSGPTQPAANLRQDGSGRISRSNCIAPLEHVKLVRRSGRTHLDTCGRDATRWRCP